MMMDEEAMLSKLPIPPPQMSIKKKTLEDNSSHVRTRNYLFGVYLCFPCVVLSTVKRRVKVLSKSFSIKRTFLWFLPLSRTFYHFKTFEGNMAINLSNI